MWNLGVTLVLFSDNASIVPCDSPSTDTEVRKRYFLLRSPVIIFPSGVWKFNTVHSWSWPQPTQGRSWFRNLRQCQAITQVEEKPSCCWSSLHSPVHAVCVIPSGPAALSCFCTRSAGWIFLPRIPRLSSQVPCSHHFLSSILLPP